MPVSKKFKLAANARETDEVFIILITIDHSDITEPIRVTGDTANTTSRGNLFVSLPFKIELPTSADGEIPRAKIQISNIDRRIVKAVREISPGSDPATVLIEVALASDPDIIEMSLPDFNLSNAKYDRLYVEGEITQESFFSEPWPKDTFNPATFPGIF